MPSPVIDSTASSTFPKRKRRSNVRDSDAGSLQTQPQKKRSKIETNTFRDPDPSIHTNGRLSNGRSSLNIYTTSHQSLDIPTRTKPQRRSVQDERAQLLTETSHYSAKSIIGLPDQLRNLDRTAFRVWLPSASRLVLATTLAKAFIWDRNAGLRSPTARVFNIPSRSSEGDPVPLGALVNFPEARETGLVVISAGTGKIAYWQNLEDAEALSLFEKNRNGLEGSISLMTGESVDRIDSAGHAGFLLVTSAGRTAQLLLRDTQGRPCISIVFLRGDGSNTTTGFLSGLRNALVGSNWLKNTRAAKARPSSTARGQMEVLLANDDGIFQSWKLGWSGQITFVGEVDAQKMLRDTVMQSLGTSVEQESSIQVKLFDFAFTSDGHSLRKRIPSTAQDYSTILLVGLVAPTATSFALVELSIVDGEPLLGNILHLKTYESPLTISKSWKPTLVLSESSRTGLVVFNKAIAVVSLAWPERPHESRNVLEETLHLRDDEDVSCVGVNIEEDRHAERAGHVIFAVFIRSHGLVRLQVNEPLDHTEASQRRAISIEGKIRQAVFFGNKTNTPFDFSKGSHHESQIAEVEEAAEQVSNAILTSNTPEGKAQDIIIHHSLSIRAGYMHNLAQHLKSTYPRLSRNTRWRLMRDAEKIAAAQEIWRIYDVRRSQNEDTPRFLPDIIEQMSDSYHAEMDKEKGERDVLRHFFLKSLEHMDALVFWTFKALSDNVKHGDVDEDSPTFAVYLSDAIEIVIAILGTAFKFRQEFAYAFSLDDEPLHGGILDASAYKGLPSLWTSEKEMILQVEQLLDSSLEYTLGLYELEEEPNAVTGEAARRIAVSTPQVIEILNSAFLERSRCFAQSSKADTRIQGAALEKRRREMLNRELPKLFALGEVEHAYALGERFAEMPALVRLFRDEVAIAQSKADPLETQRVLNRLEGRQRRWFDKFGQRWADEFYGNLFEHRRYTSLLKQSSSNRAELTRFLRSDVSRAKISWINEVIVEEDFWQAASQLLEDATQQASDRINRAEDEVALAKLCLLAIEESGDKPAGFDELQIKCNHAATLANAKCDLLEQVKDSANSGVDREAGVQLITNDFCLEPAESTLGQLFHSAFESLWLRDAPPTADGLVDIMTLMREDVSGRLLSAAIQILQKPNMERASALYRLIWAMTWRRIFIRDEWDKFNTTEELTDSAITAALEKTALYNVLYQGQIKGLFSGSDAVQVPEPQSVLGYGSEAADHECRFSDETVRKKLARALVAEDRRLQDYIEHHRLEHWVVTVSERASASIQYEKEAERSKQKQLADAVEQMIKDDENEYADDA